MDQFKKERQTAQQKAADLAAKFKGLSEKRKHMEETLTTIRARLISAEAEKKNALGEYAIKLLSEEQYTAKVRAWESIQKEEISLVGMIDDIRSQGAEVGASLNEAAKMAQEYQESMFATIYSDKLENFQKKTEQDLIELYSLNSLCGMGRRPDHVFFSDISCDVANSQNTRYAKVQKIIDDLKQKYATS